MSCELPGSLPDSARNVDREAYARLPDNDRPGETVTAPTCSDDTNDGEEIPMRGVTSLCVSEAEHEWVGKFRALAEKDELDIYTCLSCCCGLNGLGDSRVRFYLYYRVPILMACQLLTPMCLLSYQAKHFVWGAEDTDIEFRLVGCCMYLFSVWNMYNNSSDECRTLFLKIGREHGLSLRFTGIALLGDVINTFCGFSLVVTLFSVFCASSDPYNLVINCIAINFIGQVDNDFSGDELKEEAYLDLVKILGMHPTKTVSRTTSGLSQVSKDRKVSTQSEVLAQDQAKESESRAKCCTNLVTDSVLLILDVTRKAGTLGLGHLLCVIFAFARTDIEDTVLHSLGVHWENDS